MYNRVFYLSTIFTIFAATTLGSPRDPGGTTPIKALPYSLSKQEGRRLFPATNSDPNQGIPAIVYVLTVSSHQIEIIVPQHSGDVQAAEALLRAVLELPVKHLEVLKTLRMNLKGSQYDAFWRGTQKDFQEAGGSGGLGVIDIFPSAIPDFLAGNAGALAVLRHEFAHSLAQQIFGGLDPGFIYKTLAAHDRSFPSEYAKTNWSEDFAEGIALYLQTNAGTSDPEIRDWLRNRFRYFDLIFAI
jgi:hypothetical protein